MVFFREPSAVVSFALDIQEVIPETDLPPAHVGIAAGPVIFQDGDYFGRTVNLAARIAAHARAGQVLVTEDVVLATTDPEVRFADVGPVQLKGVPRSVRLHEAHRDGDRDTDLSSA
jgi:adenylate cyclase